MPRRELLTPTQRKDFTAFPVLDERELVKHYTLDDDALRLVRHHRGKANQLGFALQYLLLAHLGFASEVKLKPNPVVIGYVADQLEIGKRRQHATWRFRHQRDPDHCRVWDIRPHRQSLAFETSRQFGVPLWKIVNRGAQ